MSWWRTNDVEALSHGVHPGSSDPDVQTTQRAGVTVRITINRPGQRPTGLRGRLALGAITALVLGLMAGCGDDSDPTKSADQDDLAEGESLTITTFGEFGYDELIAEWNEENPDVVAIEGDFMPAVVAAPDRWVDLSSDDVDGRWLEFKSAAATAPDGELLGYATDAGPEAICYRADLFEEAGLPTDRAEVAALMTTWEDYFALGEEFVSKSDAKWYDASGSVAQAMLNQVEFPFEQADNSVDVENDELQAVYETITGYSASLATGAAQWSDDWTADFQDNAFATIPCPGWMRSVVRDNTGDPAPKGVAWDVADVFPGGGGNWGGSYLSVPKSSSHQEQAQEFAAWITAPEQQIRIFEQYGNFPSQVAALEDPALLASADPYFSEAPVGEIFSSRASAITVQPYHGPLYSDILGKFQESVTRVDQGGDPEGSWETFVDEV